MRLRAWTMLSVEPMVPCMIYAAFIKACSVNKAWNWMPCLPLPTTAPGSLKLLFLFQLRPGGQSREERDLLLLHWLREPGLSSSLGRREPGTQRQSPGSQCSLHKSSTNPLTLSASLCDREGASLARLQAASAANENPKGGTGTRVCENGPFIHPYTPYGPNLPWKALGFPPGWWQRCFDDNEGNNSSGVSIPSPVTSLQGTGRWQESWRRWNSSSRAHHAETREAFKKVQRIRTPLKSSLKV